VGRRLHRFWKGRDAIQLRGRRELVARDLHGQPDQLYEGRYNSGQDRNGGRNYALIEASRGELTRGREGAPRSGLIEGVGGHRVTS